MTLNEPAEDHRTRTAERRRDAMRARLIESAVLVFAEKGVDASVIDDVIREAGVSRGTFYKYFNTTHDLMVAASEQLGNELMAIVETHVGLIADPALRVAAGCRLFIQTALLIPVFARFTRSAGLEAAGPATLIYDVLPPHVSEGVRLGRFVDMPMHVALDLITGSVLLCVSRAAMDSDAPDLTGDVVAGILRGLGMDHSEAHTLANIQLPPFALPEDSLFRRSQRRFEEARK
jgi:AcrR family transcriptional regulator